MSALPTLALLWLAVIIPAKAEFWPTLRTRVLTSPIRLVLLLGYYALNTAAKP